MKGFLRTLVLGLLAVTSIGAMAQSRVTVTGRVLDESGNPLAGASVVLTGSPSTGTATGSDGRYSLSVPSLHGTLTVTFVGMDDAVLTLRESTTEYNATLAMAGLQVEEVVVNAGYFSRSRDNFTGSAVVVSGDELRQVNPNNLLQSIQAFDPSFRIADNNLAGSNPNRLPDVNIRGAASLPSGVGTDALRRDNISNGINMPTFILDGYEVSVEKIYDLDMNRVQSVSLLKDAAATAVYGSRAANGVLVITTVAPKEGELRLQLNYELTPSFADLSSYDVLGAKEKLQYELDAGVYDGKFMNTSQSALTQEYYKRYYNVLSGIDTDWLAQPVRNAMGQKLSLYMEGGSSTMRYGVSGQYQTMPGVMKESGRDRLGLGVDLSYYLGKNLIFKNVLSIANVVANESPYGSFSEYVNMNPYFPMRDPETGRMLQNIYTWNDGRGTDEQGNFNGSQRSTPVLNPLYNAETGTFQKDKYWEINDTFSLEWTILEGLKFRGLMSFLHRNTTLDAFTSPNANRFYNEPDPDKRGEYVYRSGESTYVDASGTLTYSKNIGDHFLMSALGVNMRTENSTAKTFSALGFSNDRFNDIGFAKGYADGSKPGSAVDKARLFGSFLSVNYSYDNRYLFDLTGRMDGSSRFGSNNNVATFWAAGIGWNIHKEAFMEAWSGTLSRLRLTANTGIVGSDSSNPYQAKTLYVYNDNRYSSGMGASVTQYGNENLKWERTTNTDFGIEVGLWDDRLFVSAHHYNKLTKNMLSDISIPSSTGFSTYKANLGDVSNKGYEVAVKANVYRDDNWNVTLTANVVGNKNKLLKIDDTLLENMNKAANDQQGWDGIGNGENANNVGLPLLRYREGWAVNTIWAVPSLGIDPQNGREIFINKDGKLTYDWNNEDIRPLRQPDPKVEGFFGGSAYYKGFMLTVSFYTRLGGYNYNQTLIHRVENANPYNNVDRRAREGRWTTPGQQALYKSIRDRNQTQVTERFIQKENTLELRSVYLSYDFQPRIYEKMGMRNLRVALTANDLWRASTIELERGIDFPFARSLTLTLQTTF